MNMASNRSRQEPSRDRPVPRAPRPSPRGARRKDARTATRRGGAEQHAAGRTGRRGPRTQEGGKEESKAGARTQDGRARRGVTGRHAGGAGTSRHAEAAVTPRSCESRAIAGPPALPTHSPPPASSAAFFAVQGSLPGLGLHGGGDTRLRSPREALSRAPPASQLLVAAGGERAAARDSEEGACVPSKGMNDKENANGNKGQGSRANFFQGGSRRSPRGQEIPAEVLRQLSAQPLVCWAEAFLGTAPRSHAGVFPSRGDSFLRLQSPRPDSPCLVWPPTSRCLPLPAAPGRFAGSETGSDSHRHVMDRAARLLLASAARRG